MCFSLNLVCLSLRLYNQWKSQCKQLANTVKRCSNIRGKCKAVLKDGRDAQPALVIGPDTY